MYYTKDGYEFNTREKVSEYESGAKTCFTSCNNLVDPPDEACIKCLIATECMKYNKEME